MPSSAIATEALSVQAYIDVLNNDLSARAARLTGEVRGVKETRGGHISFSLTDPATQAKIDCMIWKSRYAALGVVLEEGMAIVASGVPSIYPQFGKLTFVASGVQMVGEGALWRRYQELRASFERAGLFAPERKRLLPKYPVRIGVVTSLHGAVIHDFMNNLGTCGFQVVTCDARVEGAEAAPELIDAMRTLARKHIDVLVIMRGGGSLESLIGFDNEMLVREIAGYSVPVVAAIGHHKDVPLAALVADVMVSTPTAAAHALSAGWSQAMQDLTRYEHTIMSDYARALTQAGKQLSRAGEWIVRAANMRLKVVDLAAAWAMIERAMMRAFARSGSELTAAARLVEAHDPQQLLARGYALAWRNGKVVRSVKDVARGDMMEVQMKDGRVGTVVQPLHE